MLFLLLLYFRFSKNLGKAAHGGTHLLILVLRRQRQMDLFEFKATLVYMLSPRSVRVTQ